MTDFTRRSILKGGGAIASLAIAGCPGDFPKHRDLMIGGVERINDTFDPYRFRITPEKSISGGTDEWQTFHNVTLLGYFNSGEQVCKMELGTIEANEPPRLEPVVFECDEFPVVFTYEADESPCDDDTRIGYAIERTPNDGESSFYIDERRACGEGLPPGFPSD